MNGLTDTSFISRANKGVLPRSSEIIELPYHTDPLYDLLANLSLRRLVAGDLTALLDVPARSSPVETSLDLSLVPPGSSILGETYLEVLGVGGRGEICSTAGGPGVIEEQEQQLK